MLWRRRVCTQRSPASAAICGSLGRVKTSDGYALPNASDNDDEMASVAEFIRKITPAGPNLTVIRTAIGAAQRVALALDRSDWPEVVGNIGGDDTVFVATDSAASQKILVSKIERARSMKKQYFPYYPRVLRWSRHIVLCAVAKGNLRP